MDLFGKKSVKAAKPFSLSNFWRVTMITFTLVNLAISVFAWHVYVGNDIGGGLVSQPVVEGDTYVKVVDKNKLTKDLKIYSDVSKAFDNLKNQDIKIVDPSL